jgi:hypothetical protein
MSPTRLIWQMLQAASLVVLLWRSLWRFDVFIFASGVSFLQGLDLPLLRFFRKRIIVVYHGSDCRPPYINGAYVGAGTEFNVDQCIRLTRQVRRWVRWVDRYADVIVNHPYFCHFNTSPVVSWLSLGHPFELPDAPAPKATGTSCVIVHAPTRPVPKGTPEFEASIERLRARGHDVRLVKVVGRPPLEVLDAISRCDFIVDELYGDTPMAAFATEAASMGKPAVVGMHDVDSLRRTVPRELFPPSLVCHPRDLDEAIEKLVVDVAYRRELGAQAQQHVRTHLRAEAVAGRFLQLATGTVPAAWTFDPADLRYVHGWGLTEARLREVLSAVLEHGGRAALGLSDKPELEQAFWEIAYPGGDVVREVMSAAS